MNLIRKLAGALDWLRIPFTFGKTCSWKSEGQDPENRGQNKEEYAIVQSTSYNGLVSSLQLFITMVVIFVVQLLSYFMSEGVSGTQLRINLLAYMVAGLVILITIYRKRQRLLSPIQNGDSAERKDLEHDNVALAGILMFYVLGTMYDLLHILSTFSCQEAWFICGNSYYVTKDMIHITYHIVRVMFLTCQTLFCFVFNRSRFVDQIMTRHGLMILQAVNVCFWSYETMRTSNNDFYEPAKITSRKVNRFETECLSNASNYSFNLMSCLSQNDTLYYTTTYSRTILRPFCIEYSLLIGECLMRWFSTCIAKSTEKVKRKSSWSSLDSPIGTENHLDAGNSSVPRNRQSQSTAGQADQEQLTATSQQCALLRPTQDSPSQVLPVQVLPSQVLQSSLPQFLTFLLLMISVIINLLLAILLFVPRIQKAMLGPSVHMKSNLAIVVPCYSCFYYILMILVIALGYHISRYFRVLRNVPFNGLDYLLLFTSSGKLAFDVFRLIGITRSKPNGVFRSSTTRLFYAGYIFFELIETSFQVVFSLYAGRLRIDYNRGSGLKPVLFRAIILFLALCNLTTWIIQTFAVSVVSHAIMTRYFELNGWPFISGTLKPMFLFFRFNSFLLFVRIYRQICKQ